MPSHVAVAFLTIALVPLAAVITCVYALSATSRARMRWPMIIANLLAVVAVIWASSEGAALLQAVEQSASPAEIEAANDHALSSANLFYATGAMLTLVLTTAWWLLRPGRPATVLSRVASGLLIIAACASILTLGMVVAAGAEAVWLEH